MGAGPMKASPFAGHAETQSMHSMQCMVSAAAARSSPVIASGKPP